MKTSKYLILGGGMVAGYAAKELAEQGLKAGELAIASTDIAVPYERPPLSKGFLAGTEDEVKIRINAEEFYGERGIELMLGTEATGIDVGRRTVRLGSGAEREFEKLVIATGATVKTLDVPGGDLPGVFYLRSLDDSKRIRTHAKTAKRAVVVGGGFIGMETASVLARQGLETTVVLREERLGPKFFTPAMSDWFERYFSERGVRFIKRAQVEEIRDRRGLAVAVRAGGRSETLEAGMVVVGIGVRPATQMLSDSGIELGDGVVVNEFLESSEPWIYAAGDVASYLDTLFGVRRRVEHWDNAVSQGQHCARELIGDRKPFVHVPYFFSDVFDLSYEFWGDTTGGGEVVERGDPASSSFSVWWLKNKCVVAAFTMNRPDEEREAAPRWIESKCRLAPEDLRAEQWVA